MKNLIFSIYSPITENGIRTKTHFAKCDEMSKSQHTHTQFEKYKDQLIKVKTSYAKQCDADFMLIESIDKHFFADEFDNLNFYKHYLIEKFCNDYENILYLDFDVIPNTTQSFFDHHNMDVINVHAVNATKQNTWHSEAKQSKKNYKQVINTHFDRYHMYCKAKCKLAMLLTNDIMTDDYHVANTGIIGGSSRALSQMNMTKRIHECQQTLASAVQENMFGDEITQYFFANNETFYSYILDKYKIKWCNLSEDWHTLIFGESVYTIKHQLHNAKLIHMINKKFEKIWRDHV